MANTKDVYTSAELAQEFSVEQNTVRQWVRRGLITPLPQRVKSGRGNKMLSFSREEITRFAQGRYGHE